MKKVLLFLLITSVSFATPKTATAEISTWASITIEIVFFSVGIGTSIFCKKKVIKDCEEKLKFLEDLAKHLELEKIEDLTSELMAEKKSLDFAINNGEFFFLKDLINDQKNIKKIKKKNLIGKIVFWSGIVVSLISGGFLLKDVIKGLKSSCEKDRATGEESHEKADKISKQKRCSLNYAIECSKKRYEKLSNRLDGKISERVSSKMKEFEKVVEQRPVFEDKIAKVHKELYEIIKDEENKIPTNKFAKEEVIEILEKPI